jgi:hypothetical protein
MSHTLHTLVAANSYNEDIRKSRFLAQAAPVETPQQALGYVQQVSDPSLADSARSKMKLVVIVTGLSKTNPFIRRMRVLVFDYVP